MIYRDGSTLVVEGGVTVRNVVALTRQGIELLDSSTVRIDLQKITAVDSTAISMLLEWQRAANRKGCRAEFVHFPESLASLAQLYGVISIFTSSSDYSSVP